MSDMYKMGGRNVMKTQVSKTNFDSLLQSIRVVNFQAYHITPYQRESVSLIGGLIPDSNTGDPTA
jgi:hypothetical protein